jgi:hypothetical protein
MAVARQTVVVMAASSHRGLDKYGARLAGSILAGRVATSGARLNLVEARALAAVAGVKVERRGQTGRAIP